jgi:hypothetical protein
MLYYAIENSPDNLIKILHKSNSFLALSDTFPDLTKYAEISSGYLVKCCCATCSLISECKLNKYDIPCDLFKLGGRK